MIFQLVLLVAAVTWIAPRVASGASVALPIPDPRTCVPRTSAAKYGWITPIGSFQGTSGQATILQPLAPSVTLEVGTWESSLITNTVAGILLRDIFGAAVTLQQFNSSAGSITRIGRGSIDMNFEAWPSSFGSDYALLVIQSGLVEDLGATGYSGKQAWFINQAITAANPTVIFDSWMSFKVPAVIARLPRVGTTAPSRRIDGSTLCDSQFSFCSRGTFVPPQCAGSLAQSCGEFWSLDPLLSNGANEQRIVDLGLKLVVVYLTEPDLYANAERCAAQPTSLCLFAHQSPSAISDSLSVSPVNLPDYVPRCWNQFSSAQVPASHLSCDSPMEVLTKLSTVGIANRAPHLRSFARYFTLRDIDIQSLTSATLASADTWAIACQWISQYPTIWESWVGAPPIGYCMPFLFIAVIGAVLI
ncbi:hypothetical protein BC828DRAFT_259726 [Blastocladiella britannica]|nr:hypothetical protein BC828DRAFT_259726 [Blastocladiella britannica]